MNQRNASECFDRKARLAFGIVLAVALGLRIGVVLVKADQLRLDPDGYRALEIQLAEGRGLVSPAAGRPTAYRPPLYPLLLAGLASVDPELVSLGFVQAVLGTLNVFLCSVLARRLAGPWAGVSAAAWLTVDPLSLLYTAYAMTETLFTTLVLLVLFEASRHAPTTSSRFRCGAWFGLAVLCRPTALPWVAVWIAWIAFEGLPGRRRVSTLLKPAIACIPLVAGSLLIVMPWVVRNLLVLGSPILTTTHGGYTLLLANNPVVYEEEVMQPWGVTWEDAPAGRTQADWFRSVQAEMQQHFGRDPGEIEADRWMSARAWETIREQPALFARSVWFRIRRLWNVVPLGPAAKTMNPQIVRLIGLFSAIMFAAAVFGIVRWGRAIFPLTFSSGTSTENDAEEIARRLRSSRTVMAGALAFLIALTAIHAVYWSNARMRTPAMPLAAIFAGAALFRPDPLTRALPSCRRSSGPSA